MECNNCGSHIDLVRGSYEFQTKELGLVVVPEITVHQCSNVHCREETLDSDEASKVSDFVAGEVRVAIGNLPVGEFVTAEEAREILDITKQAFSKNKRIKRGFIYSTSIGNRRLYYRPSVEAFKVGQDGRVPLHHEAGKGGLAPYFDTKVAMSSVHEATQARVRFVSNYTSFGSEVVDALESEDHGAESRVEVILPVQTVDSSSRSNLH